MQTACGCSMVMRIRRSLSYGISMFWTTQPPCYAVGHGGSSDGSKWLRHTAIADDLCEALDPRLRGGKGVSLATAWVPLLEPFRGGPTKE